MEICRGLPDVWHADLIFQSADIGFDIWIRRCSPLGDMKNFNYTDGVIRSKCSLCTVVPCHRLCVYHLVNTASCIERVISKGLYFTSVKITLCISNSQGTSKVSSGGNYGGYVRQDDTSMSCLQNLSEPCTEYIVAGESYWFTMLFCFGLWQRYLC